MGRWCVLAFVSFLLCVLLACKGSDKSEPKSFGVEKFDSAALHVALISNKDCLPIYVAERSGIFDSLGLKVQIASYASQLDSDTTLLKDICDGGWADSIRLDSYGNVAKNFEVLFNGKASWHLYVCDAMRIKETKALKGRTIAIARASAENDFLNQVLKANGLAQEDVYRPQINNLKLRSQMLSGNQIDAAVLTWPYTSLARSEGHRELASPIKYGGGGYFVIKRGEKSDPERKRKWELFEKGRNMAFDSLRIKGLKAYSAILRDDYGLPKELIDTLKMF